MKRFVSTIVLAFGYLSCHLQDDPQKAQDSGMDVSAPHDAEIPASVPEAAPAPDASVCGDDVLITSPTGNYCIDRYEWPNKKGELPAYAQTAYDAVSKCESVGKELCTEDQWYRACEGSKWQRYSYSNVYKQGTCNDDKLWRFVAWDRMANQEEWLKIAAALYQGEPSGQREECVSTEGVHDMIGNVAEWTVSPRSPHGFVVKGCYWSGCMAAVPSCEFVNNAHAPKFNSYEFGFRCCRPLR